MTSEVIQMKFTCEQQTLVKALNTVSKAVTSRTTIPILKGILLNVKNGKLILSASDLEISIEKSIEVNVIEEGSTVVMARLFSDIVRKLPNEEISISQEINGKILIKSAFSEFNIVGLNSDEFPSIGNITEEETDKLVFDKDIFKDMIRKSSFAASADDSKGVIVGVLMECKDNHLNMIALDGFRMAVIREKMIIDKEQNIIVSAKLLNEISKIISEEEAQKDIEMILDNKKALIKIDSTKVILRLLEGQFIKYRDILPKEKKCIIKINRSNLQNSIERASLLAKEGKNNLIKMTILGNLLTITSKSEEGDVKEEIIMEKTGEDIVIGFNSKYISDVLKVVDEEELLMEFNTPTSPCLIKQIEGNRFEYLVLPVRITA